MKNFFRDFKKFISRGNVVDMAVGLIIATAFNKIVSSLVNDIIMPCVTYFLGAASLAELSLPLRVVDGVVTLSWNYGAFLQTVIDFLIIALSIFVMVKIMVRSQKRFQQVTNFLKQETSKEAEAKRKELRAEAKRTGKKYSVLLKEYRNEQARMKKELADREAEAKRIAEEEAKNALPQDTALLLEIAQTLKQMREDKILDQKTTGKDDKKTTEKD